MKKKVGFPISRKKNENRRCLIPADISLIKNKKSIYVEEGYGLVLGFSDQDYIEAGVNIANREDVLIKDIICDPKIGDAEYLTELKEQTIYGWIHAVQNKPITDAILEANLTAYAWEEMFDRGRHVFWRNNEIAGEAAIMHAYSLFGLFPYDTKVALIGRGNIARGAGKILTLLGAEVTVFTREMEKLLRDDIDKFDVIVNAVLWDTGRRDHIVYFDDLLRMKKGAMIIDISCDRAGAIESCIPTTIDKPGYITNGVFHYAVDHTPSIFYKTISKSLSKEVSLTIDFLIETNTDEILKKSLIIENGKILDNKIIAFQCR